MKVIKKIEKSIKVEVITDRATIISMMEDTIDKPIEKLVRLKTATLSK